MKLKSIEITLQPSWADNAGKYEAKIEYEGQRGEVRLLLDPKVSEALMVCIGQTIVQFSHMTAKQLEAEITNAVAEARATPAIEAATS